MTSPTGKGTTISHHVGSHEKDGWDSLEVPLLLQGLGSEAETVFQATRYFGNISFKFPILQQRKLKYRVYQ